MADSDCVLKLKVLRPNTQKGEFDERIFKNAIDRAIGGKIKSVEWAILTDNLAPKKKKAKKSKEAEGMTAEEDEEKAAADGVKAYNVAVKFVNSIEADKMRAHIEKGKGAMGCKLEILDMEDEETEKFWSKCQTSMKKAKINSKKIRKETKEMEDESLRKFSEHIEAQRKRIFGETRKRKAQPIVKKKGKKPKKK